MGTRNLTCVFYKGEYKVAQYCQWDGYPDGQGRTIVEFLHTCNLDKFKEVLEQASWASEREIRDAWCEAGANPNDSWVNLEVSKKMQSLYPHFSRDMGAKILQYLYEWPLHRWAKPIKLKDSLDFAADSLFCEWAYVIDLDKGTLEVYNGFNTEAIEENERFANLPLTDRDGETQYYPITHLITFSLDELPSPDLFVEVVQDAAEEAEAEE